MNYKNHKKKAFTLIEIAIVLGVIGAILSLIWSAANDAREAQKENEALVEIQIVVQNILNIMQGRSFLAPMISPHIPITPQMITAGVIPDNYIEPTHPTTQAFNPWGRDTNLSNNSFVIWAMDAKTFRISFYGVSRSGCLSLLLANTACQVGHMGCPKKAMTNNSDTYLLPDSTTGWQVMTTSQASLMCADNVLNGGSVEFDYGL